MTHKLKTETFSQKIEHSGGVNFLPLTPIFSFVSFHLKVVKYLTTHFASFRIFPLLAGGVARRDVIIYKVDRVCIIMKEIVTISIRVSLLTFKNRL